ncbi:MAG: phosphohydrolase [bacterium]|nr:phosphohydrolase [bacterium]
MSFITTFTGKKFDPINPEVELIDIRDIAHALSMLCRANGHVKHFYTVGQHSLACYYEAEARGYSEKIKMACLLHDASEAYLSDVTRPIKATLPEYLVVEDKLQSVIWNKFLPSPLTKEEEKTVFEIDDDMLAYEFKHLMPRELSDRYNNIVGAHDLSFTDPQLVEDQLFKLMNKDLK